MKDPNFVEEEPDHQTKRRYNEDLPIHPVMKDVYAFIANAKTTKTKMISDIIILKVLADELNEEIHKLYQS